jgi:hypothetical protein
VGNEPDNEIQATYGMDAYVQMYRNIDAELRAAGIRDRVTLTGPDMGGQWGFFQDALDQMNGIVDAWDFHRYASWRETGNFDLPGDWETLYSHLDLWRGEAIARDPQGSLREILITEAGRDGGVTNGHPQIDTYEYALHMADYATTVLKTRLNGVVAWNAYDLYYFDWGQFMRWGMWGYKTDNWALRPWAQAWALASKYAPNGSVKAIVNGTPPTHPGIEQTRCAAVIRPDGKWSVFLVNRMAEAKTFSVTFPVAVAAMNRYQIDRSTWVAQSNALLVAPIGTVPVGSGFTLDMPAESFTVLAEEGTAQPPPPPVVLPEIRITSPTDGSLLARKSTVQIVSAVTVGSDPIQRVDTYVGTELRCSDFSVPFVCTWKVPASVGKQYIIRSVVYDSVGRTDQDTIQVTVRR